MKKQFFVVAIILSFLFCSIISHAAGSYKRYNLPHGISVEIPLGWKILTKGTTRQLDNETETITGTNQSNNDILIAANCYTNKKIPSASIRISFRNINSEFTQEDLQNFTKNDIDIIKQYAITSSDKLNKAQNTKIDLNSIKIDIKKISGLYSILTLSINHQNGFPGCNLFYLVPVNNGTIKIYASYNKNEKYLVNIIDKILSSIQISN